MSEAARLKSCTEPGSDGLAKSIVIASPANESPVLRLRATLLAHLVAEYWRDQGKNVLLLVDSITRLLTHREKLGWQSESRRPRKVIRLQFLHYCPNLLNDQVSVVTVMARLPLFIQCCLRVMIDRTHHRYMRASPDGQVMLSRERLTRLSIRQLTRRAQSVA